MLNDTISFRLTDEEIRCLIPTTMDRSVHRKYVREEIMREVDGEEMLDYITCLRNDSDTMRYHDQVREYECNLEKSTQSRKVIQHLINYINSDMFEKHKHNER